VLQFTPQVVPLQTGFPFDGSVHAVQPFALQPEAVLLLATQDVGLVAGQPWKPASHTTVQALPLQDGVPPDGSVHAVQPFALQPEAGLLLATQLLPQRW
jgi:hypothetical protein